MSKKEKYSEEIKENKYYDDWKCKSISEQMAKRPYYTLEELEKYIYEYPEDYKAKGLYAFNLVKVGELEESWKLLKEIEDYFETSYFMSLPLKLREKMEYHLITTRLKILMYQQKYDDFLDYWVAYNDILFKNGEQIEAVRAYYYAKEQLGKPALDERENTSYLFRQIHSYDEERFIEHAKEQNYGEDKHCKFYPEFPLEKAISEVKKYIMSENVDRIYTGYLEDLYVFKYDTCGMDIDGKKLDYFSAVTFHNTDKFISINPFPFGLGHKAVDLNYLKDEEKPSMKRKSQIDKFNERYKNY